jgi:excisionase family DNA binding protein
MPEVQVKIVEPAALSPEGAAEYLSISRRALYFLLADKVLIARKAGSRTLIDFESVKAYYKSLPLVTVSASIPNAPQSLPAARRRKAVRS